MRIYKLNIKFTVFAVIVFLLSWAIFLNDASAQSSWLSNTIPRVQSQNEFADPYNANPAVNYQQPIVSSSGSYYSQSGTLSESEIFALTPQESDWYYQDIPQQNQLKANINPSIYGVPADENALIDWVINSGDNYGRPFLIANKRMGEVIYVEANGIIVSRTAALFGIRKGDGMLKNQTPSGIYNITRVNAQHPGYGGDVLAFANDDVNKVTISIHRVWLESPSERRLERLASPNPSQRRISDGCVNLPDDFYESIAAAVDGSKIYIMPETRDFF